MGWAKKAHKAKKALIEKAHRVKISTKALGLGPTHGPSLT